MQKQKTRSRKAEEAPQVEAKVRESDLDPEALDKLLDEIDAKIEEEEAIQVEEELLAWIEKLKSIQTSRSRPHGCDQGTLAGDYEYVVSVY